MTTAIDCHAVTKRYGANTVVDAITLNVPAGTTHSLVGANGAGKSTLLGMMSGRVVPTSGTVDILGQKLHTGRPKEARKAGLTAVYQELTILPALTAVENVFLGQEVSNGMLLSEKQMRTRFAELADEFDVNVDPRTRAGSLSVATAQMLEIMRAVQADAKVILFDEPTAALSQRERDQFLTLVRQLKARGLTMVLVTHNLGEVLAVSDDVTVMTSGRKVAVAPAADWNRSSLVEAMTGDQPAVRPAQRGHSIGPVVLEARNLTLPGAVAGIDLTVRRGEVLGLAGLVGSGRTSVLRSLAGAERSSTGDLTLRGQTKPWPKNVRQAIRLGIGLVPEERKTQGLHLRMSLPDNVTLPKLAAVSKGGLVETKRQLHIASELLRSLAISRDVGPYPVDQLSGGNQQKVAVAKWLFANPDVLLVDEPTRGIDVAAKADVLDAIRAAADSGKAVIVTSSEIDEVLEISDRVLVLSEGALAGEFDLHTSSPTVGDILQSAFRVKGTA